MKQFKTSGSRSRRTLISKASKYGKIDNNVFCKSNKGKKSKSRATNSIIYSVLTIGSHKVGKYLIQISIRELKNDLVKPKNEGGLSEVWNGNKLLVSDTGLRYIISVNVKKFTPRYKQMCGCEVFIQTKQLQRSLNT